MTKAFEEYLKTFTPRERREIKAHSKKLIADYERSKKAMTSDKKGKKT